VPEDRDINNLTAPLDDARGSDETGGRGDQSRHGGIPRDWSGDWREFNSQFWS